MPSHASRRWPRARSKASRLSITTSLRSTHCLIPLPLFFSDDTRSLLLILAFALGETCGPEPVDPLLPLRPLVRLDILVTG